MPPHHGHRLVIQTAVGQSEQVHLVVCQQVDDPILASLRADWLRQLYPRAMVSILDVAFPVTDAEAWAQGTMDVVGKKPSAVFTSEEYGHRLAELLNATHVLVDQHRTKVPISASQIRQDPQRYREFLDPVVWEYFKPA